MIDKKVEETERRLGEQQEVEGESLTYLLSNTQLTCKEVYGSVMELLLAGVDTRDESVATDSFTTNESRIRKR